MTRFPAGMYRPGYSLIHDIGALAKLICFFLMLAAVAATDSAAGFAVTLASAAAVVYLAQVGLAAAFSFAGRLAWLFALIILSNALFYAPDEAPFRWWIFAPSLAGFAHGALIAARSLIVLVLCNVLSLTTSPMKLTAGLRRLFSPLRFVGLPAGRIALIISAAIQFIPAFFTDADMIAEAQTARGARFDCKNYFEKASAVLPLAVPVFVAAFRRANELALGLTARGWSADAPYTPCRREKPRAEDAAALIVSAALCALQIVVL